MNFNTVRDMASQLSYEDRLRLASLLIQMTLTESTSAGKVASDTPSESEEYMYCLERIQKARPNRLPALQNYLEAILAYRGSGSVDINDIIKRLQIRKVIKLDGDNITYLD